jgi:hypothetical protein
MPVETAVAREHELADASSHTVQPPLRGDAGPRPVPPRRGAGRTRGRAEVLLLIGVAAVAGPPVVALAAASVLVAFALAGPFFLAAILLVAVVLVAFIATGSAG